KTRSPAQERARILRVLESQRISQEGLMPSAHEVSRGDVLRNLITANRRSDQEQKECLHDPSPRRDLSPHAAAPHSPRATALANTDGSATDTNSDLSLTGMPST